MANIFALDDLNKENDKVTKNLLFRYHDCTYGTKLYKVIKHINHITFC